MTLDPTWLLARAHAKRQSAIAERDKASRFPEGSRPWRFHMNLADDFDREAEVFENAAGSGWRAASELGPRDYPRVLALVDGDVRIVAWGKTSHVPIYGWCLADQGVEDFDLCHFDVWMPLPPPPASPPLIGEEG